ncbi:hypothetical protein BCV69DRAFT_296459 [Microstroma glucosiphilum]|uniref:UBX domain-containing protein n=1 Tax=Pseudomicrostroma glucosiphilum TaxID=1684307 RepID=A0A316UGW0_9BASI|nr:hypothetical protein BCV69DRAFT_296459 [Pseudomicrostroma glucosiphilum]PWN24168.1 hypothetical protein BCV69DRAFT_296459 [Pseudomicrostroma glucosiphilum]
MAENDTPVIAPPVGATPAAVSSTSTSAPPPPPPTPAATSTPTASASSAFPRPKVLLPPSSFPSSSSSAAATAPATLTPPLPAPSDEAKPTMAELQAAYASTIQSNKRAGVGPDAPLMTQAMRDKHESRAGGPGRRAFEEIHVRFRFSDRTLLEYTLPSTTPLPNLYPLLRSALLSTHSSKPFTLYTSPPKIDFPEEGITGPPLPAALPGRPRVAKKPGQEFRGKTIGEMGWGGGAIVSVRWTGAGDEGLNSSAALAPISEDLRGEGKPLEAPKMGETQGGAAPAAGGQTLGGPSSSVEGEAREKKVPKWFKGIGSEKVVDTSVYTSRKIRVPFLFYMKLSKVAKDDT